MQAIILKSRPLAQYHFGEFGIDEYTLGYSSDLIHADTLFSAIINIYAENFTDTNTFIELLKQHPFSISSGFHCLQGARGTLFFLPKPVFLNTTLTNSDEYKKIKRVKYLSKGVWEQGIAADDLINNERNELIQLDDKFICLASELSSIIDHEIDTSLFRKVKLYQFGAYNKVKNHTREETNRLYLQTNLQINDLSHFGLSVHYYFLLDEALPAESKAKLNFVLSLLPDTGIGGERSTGCGKFWGMETHTFALNIPEISAYGCSTSLISPRNHTELKHIRCYDTLKRGGRRLLQGGQLKEVRMIAEGALITASTSVGQLVDISPKNDNSFLRFGKSLTISMHANWTYDS